MNKNLTVMQTNIATEIQDTSTAMKAIIKEYINYRYFQILQSINHKGIQPDYSFSTVAGTQDYALPEDFDKPVKVVDSTNGIELAEWDWEHVIRRYPNTFSGSGDLERYSIIEDTVRNQPTSASVLACTSSSASDTAVTLLIRGIVSGSITHETVTLTGTSPANTTNQYTRIISISKSGESVGYVTVTSNSAAVTLAVMSPEVITSYCKKIRLHYVPTAVVTIACPYIIRPLPLIETYDYPILDIADGIELGAKADAWRYKRQFSKATVFDAQFTSWLADYIWYKENSANQLKLFRPDVQSRDDIY